MIVQKSDNLKYVFWFFLLDLTAVFLESNHIGKFDDELPTAREEQKWFSELSVHRQLYSELSVYRHTVIESCLYTENCIENCL